MKTNALIIALAISLCAACGNDPQHDDDMGSTDMAPMTTPSVEENYQALLRDRLELEKLEPLEMPTPRDQAKVKLGQALFFDPIISGSRDAACSTCHRPHQATVDGLSLPVGTAARVDPETGARTPGPQLDFVPRNVPDLFNRGHVETRTMFWDMRMEVVEVDGEQRFRLADTNDSYSPGNFLREMPEGLDNVLAAQNMLPVLNRLELRGANGSKDALDPEKSNELATVHDGDLEEVWRKLMKRLLEVQGYRDMFAAAYPDIPYEDLTFVHAANGISAFIIDSFTFLDSPWDRFVAGDDDALTDAQARGALLFYGDAKCSVCHSGALLTDQKFYNIGVRPVSRGPDATEFLDRGVAHRSIAGPDDSFAFRTPPLRNVALTAPYMHTGIYNDLEQVIRHKMDIERGLWLYDSSIMRPEFSRLVHNGADRLTQVAETLVPWLSLGIELTDDEVDDLVAFLESLTSPSALDLSHVVPESVPSGLEIPIPEQPRPVEAGE